MWASLSLLSELPFHRKPPGDSHWAPPEKNLHLRDRKPLIGAHEKEAADRIKGEVHNFAEANSIDLRLIGLESWFIPHFVPADPKTSRDLRDIADLMKQEILCQYMRYHGVYLPDLHTVFVSAVHSEEDADKIIDAFKKSLVEMREDGHL
jgi:glutamate-1-semialdehyde 2,1-aminomutase